MPRLINNTLALSSWKWPPWSWGGTYLMIYCQVMVESIEFFPSFPDQSSLDMRTETHQLWKIQKDHRQTTASCFFCKDLKCPFLCPAWVHKSYRKLRVGFKVRETSKDTSGAWIPQSLNHAGPMTLLRGPQVPSPWLLAPTLCSSNPRSGDRSPRWHCPGSLEWSLLSTAVLSPFQWFPFSQPWILSIKHPSVAF